MRSIHLRGAEAPSHPRIFRKRVRAADPGIGPGEVVAVRTAEGRFVGRAFFSPRSVVAARILDREEAGPPVDAAWFRGRIRAAHELRARVLGLPESTDAFRVVHAEGDGLSALVIDRYADVAVIEVGSRAMFEHLHELEECVRALPGISRVVVRADPTAERIEGFSAEDRRAGPAETVITEHGLRFRVDCRGGHKTGFFLDQRESRRAVGELARGRRVLDLCCYTGGFALSAARGGAASARGVDLDETAIERARANAALNGLNASFEHADAFDVLRAGARGDLVLLDPPKLASRREELPRARRKSVDLNTHALACVEPGGLLFTFCCTGLFSPDDFQGHVREASHRAGRPARVLRVAGQPPDHPVDLQCPEGRYFTGLLLQVA
ncbi:MAG: class I SAM-dependent rRNA methyltransferase [Planctomycetota bacterium]